MLALRRSVNSLARDGTLSMVTKKLKHSLPPMPYAFNALEPIICSEIMELHYKKHHGTYVNNLNTLQEELNAAIAKNDVTKIINLQPGLRFNGGGHLNHSIFWTTLTPPSSTGKPSPELATAINKDFGSLDKMTTMLSTMAVQVQGSGWAWLAYDPNYKRLQLAACANQDPLEGTTGLIPLFGIDVWEHAYYIQYKNARADYVKNIWQIVNWKNVSERYAKARGSNLDE